MDASTTLICSTVSEWHFLFIWCSSQYQLRSSCKSCIDPSSIICFAFTELNILQCSYNRLANCEVNRTANQCSAGCEGCVGEREGVRGVWNIHPDSCTVRNGTVMVERDILKHTTLNLSCRRSIHNNQRRDGRERWCAGDTDSSECEYTPCGYEEWCVDDRRLFRGEIKADGAECNSAGSDLKHACGIFTLSGEFSDCLMN